MVTSFLYQTLKAIGFMHSHGLTHTDLKPENILLASGELETQVLSRRFTVPPIHVLLSEEKLAYRNAIPVM